MSDNVLSVIPTDPCWQPGYDAAANAVHALRAVTPEDDGTRAEWTETMMFVACGSNFERLSCPECDSVLDQMWWRDLFCDLPDVLDRTELLDITVPCCGAQLSMNDLAYDWPCGFARFEISIWNPGRSWLSDSELAAVGEALGYPVRQILAHW